MIDRARTTDGVEARDVPDGALSALEQRVRRLEDAVAGLQDTRQLEDRVVERLGRVRAEPAHPPPAPILSPSRLLPAALDIITNPGRAAEPPSGPVAGAPGYARRTWLLWDLYVEVRVILRMFVDPRYRMGWQARVLPLILLGLMFTSFIWVPGASLLPSFLSWPLLQAVDLILAYVLFKILSREALLYRQTSPDLPPMFRP